MLPLSYLLCSILCVAILATLGAERKLRSLILLPLTLLVTLAAWQFGDDAAGTLPGGGGPFPWAWFPLAAAWLAALAGPSGSRVVPLAVLLLAGLAVGGFAETAASTPPDSPAPLTAPVSPATAVALAAHRTLAVALAAVALAALARLGSGFPQGPQLAGWRFLSLLSGGMLLGLILGLAYLYFVQDHPLGLDPRIAWTVLLAETIAAFCVYRGVHAVTQPDTSIKPNPSTKPNPSVKPGGGGASGDGDWEASAEGAGRNIGAARSIGAARATALLVLFALAGGGLSLIPIILNGATRLGQ